MKNILASGNRHFLNSFLRSNVLLAFDYDGTLAPISDTPEGAAMRHTTRELLWEVTRHWPVIVISGRAQPDALRRLRGAGVLEVVGNHGIEPWHAANRYVDEVRAWMPRLQEALGAIPGVAIEDKIYSVAVHYRQAADKRKALSAILEVAGALGDVRLIRGKQVVNILSRGAPHKGEALERERARLLCDAALYVGDDETDEDVFGYDRAQRLLAIRVGRKRGSAAGYYLPNQRAIDQLLRRILEQRVSHGSLAHG